MGYEITYSPDESTYRWLCAMAEKENLPLDLVVDNIIKKHKFVAENAKDLEKRIFIRYAIDCPALLQFSAEDGLFRSICVRINDISLGGAQIATKSKLDCLYSNTEQLLNLLFFVPQSSPIEVLCKISRSICIPSNPRMGVEFVTGDIEGIRELVKGAMHR